MVTLLVPTAKRPELLVTALRSVSEQTAANQIAEVIVSESAGDFRSGEVCKQFPSLPINYIFRDPQMQMTEHFSALKKAKWSGEYTVMLHDDDWWTPDFLSKGIEALNSHPKASTFCCNSYHVLSEQDTLHCGPDFAFWFAANYPTIKPIWEMSRQEVLVACLLHTPAHYSTIMGRAEAFRSSAEIYDTGNIWDVDRMFVFELSRYGTLLYSQVPQAFYRFHGQQLTTSFSDDKKTTQMCQTSEWMIKRSGETLEAIGNLFYARMEHCPTHKRGNLYHLAMQPWALPLLAKHLGDSSDIGKLYKQIRKRTRFKEWIKPYCPPIIFEKGKSFLNKRGK
ncbi:MAG: glycosyltransferase family 2 protein [Methylacidiphilales bacterium]|nr:glycosyltransferase family 2 protein [Candidatus Methylacidiphilales bacterium]